MLWGPSLHLWRWRGALRWQLWSPKENNVFMEQRVTCPSCLTVLRSVPGIATRQRLPPRVFRDRPYEGSSWNAIRIYSTVQRSQFGRFLLRPDQVLCLTSFVSPCSLARVPSRQSFLNNTSAGDNDVTEPSRSEPILILEFRIAIVTEAGVRSPLLASVT